VPSAAKSRAIHQLVAVAIDHRANHLKAVRAESFAVTNTCNLAMSTSLFVVHLHIQPEAA
jgi:hypothetical protein